MSENFLSFTQEIAQSAGSILLDNYHKDFDVRKKDDGTLVSEIDLAANTDIVQHIKKKYPEHNIFSEESQDLKNDSDYLWIIDPLDGTTNYVHQIDYFCVSIALKYKNELIIGVIYDPIRKELFSAQQNTGAILNDQTITVNQSNDLSQSIACLNRGAGPASRLEHARIFEKISLAVKTHRILGSCALGLCYIANGRMDLFSGNGINYYDAAAGALIAKEAGAKISNFENKPWNPNPDSNDSLIVSSPQLHSSILNIIKT